MRTLCAWFPGWPLDRPDAPPDRAVLVVEDGASSKLVAATSAAIAAGARLGMGRREAEGLCPEAVVLVRDLAEEARRFEPVVATIEEQIPRVEVAEPGLVFIPLAGAVRYYGGESEVVEVLMGKLSAGGFDVRLGLADGPFAAYWAARRAMPGAPHLVADTRRFLAELDVSTLGHDELVATFRWLGVTTLGELAGLPRPAIASRFGPEGLAVHRLASGEDRLVDPRSIPPELGVEAHFEEPLEMMEQVGFASRSLAARLLTGLRREGIAPHRVVVEIEAADGTTRSRVWRSAEPFAEKTLADRVWWQVRAWVDQGQVPGGVTRLRLDPSDLSGEGRQLAFFEDIAARAEAERALARAQALVGPDAVLQAVAQGGRLPLERVAWHRWGEDTATLVRDTAAPWPGATPSPTPALVPPQPTPLEVEWDGGLPVRIRLGSRWEPVLTWSGPWRTTGRWWRREGDGNRYQLVTSAGAFLCVVEEGRTFLAGIYD